MKPNRKIIRWVVLPVLSFLGVAAVYVLSIGPVVFMWKTFDLSDKGPFAEVVFSLYDPLDRLPEDLAIKKALNFYVRLWEPGE